MGLFNVSPMDWISKVMDFSQTSLENTVDTIKEVQQTIVEIPINIAEELGLPEETSAELKDKHRRILDHVMDGVCDACGEVNEYIVKQAEAVNDFANFTPSPTKPKLLRLETNKDAGEPGQGTKAG